MNAISISSVTGTPPFDIYVCDITLSTCIQVGSSVPIPPTFTATIPSPLNTLENIVIKIIDSLNCETIKFISCIPTPTPTPTRTPTPTPTNLCFCISAENTGFNDSYFNYTDCNGVLHTSVSVPSGVTYYVCGSNPTNVNHLNITVGPNCVSNSCPEPSQTPTVTPTATPTVTPTISVTPTVTPTISVTPTNSPLPCNCYELYGGTSTTRFIYKDCNDTTTSLLVLAGNTEKRCASTVPTIVAGDGTVTFVGQCVSSNCPTPTPTPTPTRTPTPTPTPTITPSSTPTTGFAYLFIEPQSGMTSIGDYMFNNSSPQFYGFTNSTQPSGNPTDFDLEMNLYVDFSGWTNGFPQILTSNVPQTTGGVDSFGNPKIAYNFETTLISAGTVSSNAWYTWLIPIGLTNFQYQSEIELSISNPNILNSYLTEPTIYANTFTYTGTTIPPVTYRVYTTYPSSDFNIDNTYVDIYFKGSLISP